MADRFPNMSNVDRMLEGRKRILTCLHKLGAETNAVVLLDLQKQYFKDYGHYLNRDELRLLFQMTRAKIQHIFTEFFKKDVDLSHDPEATGSLYIELIRPLDEALADTDLPVGNRVPVVVGEKPRLVPLTASKPKFAVPPAAKIVKRPVVQQTVGSAQKRNQLVWEEDDEEEQLQPRKGATKLGEKQKVQPAARMEQQNKNIIKAYVGKSLASQKVTNAAAMYSQQSLDVPEQNEEEEAEAEEVEGEFDEEEADERTFVDEDEEEYPLEDEEEEDDEFDKAMERGSRELGDNIAEDSGEEEGLGYELKVKKPVQPKQGSSSSTAAATVKGKPTLTLKVRHANNADRLVHEALKMRKEKEEFELAAAEAAREIQEEVEDEMDSEEEFENDEIQARKILARLEIKPKPNPRVTASAGNRQVEAIERNLLGLVVSGKANSSSATAVKPKPSVNKTKKPATHQQLSSDEAEEMPKVASKKPNVVAAVQPMVAAADSSPDELLDDEQAEEFYSETVTASVESVNTILPSHEHYNLLICIIHFLVKMKSVITAAELHATLAASTKEFAQAFKTPKELVKFVGKYCGHGIAVMDMAGQHFLNWTNEDNEAYDMLMEKVGKTIDTKINGLHQGH